MPEGFSLVGESGSAPVCIIADETRRYYGVQFHPEVTHTLQGERLLRRFLVDICGCERLWNSANIIEDSVARVRQDVGITWRVDVDWP